VVLDYLYLVIGGQSLPFGLISIQRSQPPITTISLLLLLLLHPYVSSKASINPVVVVMMMVVRMIPHRHDDHLGAWGGTEGSIDNNMTTLCQSYIYQPINPFNWSIFYFCNIITN